MRRLLWVVVALWPLLVAQTFAGKPYSADQIVKTGGGPEMVSHIYVGGQDRWRVETAGQPQATIVRLDRKVMYTLMPEAGMYYEMPMREEDTSPAYQPSTDAKVARKLLGKETIEGHPTSKYEVTVTAAGQKPQVMYEWFSPELGVPIRMEAADKSWSMEYRNIKVGPQDPKLFEVPAGFNRLTIPSMPQLQGGATP